MNLGFLAQLSTCVVAHSRLPETAPDEAAMWWQHLDHIWRRIPRRSIQFLFIDANARFEDDGKPGTGRTRHPCNANAHTFQSFSTELALDTCQSGDQCRETTLEIRWRRDASLNPGKWHWDREKMKSHSGRLEIQRLTQTCPPIAWNVHPDDHLHIVNNHLFHWLQSSFAKHPAQSRRRHVSEELWQLVRNRRYARRLVYRNKVTWKKLILHMLLLLGKRPVNVCHADVALSAKGSVGHVHARLYASPRSDWRLS